MSENIKENRLATTVNILFCSAFSLSVLSACSHVNNFALKNDTQQPSTVETLSSQHIHTELKAENTAISEDHHWEEDDDFLFTIWNPDLDPANYPSLQSLPIHTGTPVIVGQFPGQRELPATHYDEVAIQHNPVQEGTVVYLKHNGPRDLWQRIRKGFALEQYNHPGIKNDLNWYVRHPAYIDRVSRRARRYMHMIINEVEKRDMPAEIALLPIVESAFQPFAYSHGRAAGIWQFIPSTGRLYGLKQNWWYDGRRDIAASTTAALDYLNNLNRAFKGDWLLALAAYNSGQGTVNRAIRKNKRRGKPTDFWSLDLPKETRGYVPKLLAISSIIKEPTRYGIDLEEIPNEPYMTEIETGSQIDLALAADLAEISVEELYLLNPGFNRWATDPAGPHRIMLPVDKSEIFLNGLNQLASNDRINWKRHKIRKGQTLLSIADQYNTTVQLIKDINQIRGNMIREGQSLVIPVSAMPHTKYTLSAEQRLRTIQSTRRSKSLEKIVYRVRRGDTLWDISRKHKVGVRALAKWNGLAPKDTLRPGQKLVIWSKGGRLSKVSTPSFSPHASNLVTQKIGYRVRSGDSLDRISRRFKVSVSDLLRWNSISKNDYLQPGQRLTLYVDVTQQAGNI